LPAVRSSFAPLVLATSGQPAKKPAARPKTTLLKARSGPERAFSLPYPPLASKRGATERHWLHLLRLLSLFFFFS